MLSLNEDGEYDAFIVTYGFTKQEYLNMDTNTLTSRITKYVPINFDTSVFNSNELSKMVAEYSCLELWSYEYGWSEGHGDLHGAGCNSSCGDWVLSSSECGWIAYDDGSNNDGPSGGGDVSNGDVTSGGGDSSNPTGGSDSNYDPTDSNIHGNGSNGSLSSVPTVPEDVEEEAEDEEDCTSSVPDNVISELDNAFGAGNYEIDCDLSLDSLPYFSSAMEANNYFENLIDNTSSEEMASISNLGSIRRDFLDFKISNFPEASIIANVKLMIPEANNALECLQVISVNSYLDGNSTLFQWKQLDDSDPNDIDGVVVDINESNDTITITVLGRLNIGVNVGGYPVNGGKLCKIVIKYQYSTSTYMPTQSYFYKVI